MNKENMIRIKRLEKLTLENYHSLGSKGYSSDSVYDISRVGDEQHFSISFNLRQLDHPYEKKWAVSAEDLENYNLIITQGYSLGAYQ